MTNCKHKSCCTMKSKMDQTNVTSPPLNSCLSERYVKAVLLKYLNEAFSYICCLFSRNSSNFHANILAKSLKEDLLFLNNLRLG